MPPFLECAGAWYGDGGTSSPDEVVLGPGEGRIGLNVPKGVWHTVECLETGTVLFECKEGPFVPHEQEGILDVSPSVRK